MFPTDKTEKTSAEATARTASKEKEGSVFSETQADSEAVGEANKIEAQIKDIDTQYKQLDERANQLFQQIGGYSEAVEKLYIGLMKASPEALALLSASTKNLAVRLQDQQVYQMEQLEMMRGMLNELYMYPVEPPSPEEAAMIRQLRDQALKQQDDLADEPHTYSSARPTRGKEERRFKDLLDAVRAGDLGHISDLARQNDINLLWVDRGGNTALTEAIYRGYVPVADHLIRCIKKRNPGYIPDYIHANAINKRSYGCSYHSPFRRLRRLWTEPEREEKWGGPTIADLYSLVEMIALNPFLKGLYRSSYSRNVREDHDRLNAELAKADGFLLPLKSANSHSVISGLRKLDDKLIAYQCELDKRAEAQASKIDSDAQAKKDKSNEMLKPR